jgi:hypothetical protein
VLEEAMKILERFQRDKAWNDMYHSRLEAQRRRRTVELALEDERRARMAAEAERQKAEAEAARLRTLLLEHGVEPDPKG